MLVKKSCVVTFRIVMLLAYIQPAQVLPATEKDKSAMPGTWVKAAIETQRPFFGSLNGHFHIPLTFLFLPVDVLPNLLG